MSLTASVKRGLWLFRRFRRQSPGRRRLLLRAVWTLFWVRVALWVVPSRVVLRWIDAKVPAEAAEEAGPDGVRRVILAVESAGRRLPWASTCLTQALAAQQLLARAGYHSLLKIGVTRGADGAFKAHAWLEHQGRVVIGDLDLSQYTPMPDLRSAL